jgi:S1-C subfamily serine protease
LVACWKLFSARGTSNVQQAGYLLRGKQGPDMYRFFLALAIVGPCTFVLWGRPDDPAREAQVISEAVQRIAGEVEPSIACVVISYSPKAEKGANDNAAGAGTPPPNGAREPSRQSDITEASFVPEASCSGVVIDGKELLILTNYLVVRDAKQLFVRLKGNKSSLAEIYAADPRSDLAVLRLLDPHVGPLKEIRFGDGGAVRKGQVVLTATNQYAAGFRDCGPSISWGLISNLRQKAIASPREKDDRALHVMGTLLQIANFQIAALPEGRPNCSGGALLNLRGEMIGLMNNRLMTSGSDTAGGFALPVDAAMKRFIDQLRQGKEVEYGFLGVQPMPPDREPERVMIQEVVPGSPAAAAGLQPGDIIQTVNGTRVRDANDLFLALGTTLAGSEVRLEVKNRNNVVRATLVKNFVPGKIIAPRRPPLVRGFRVDYTSVLYLQTPQFPWGRQRLGIQAGVYVSEVQPGSPAAQARLQPNDVIVRVNGEPTGSPAEFYQVVERFGANMPLKVTLSRVEFNRHHEQELVIP